jgi:hypothetical protein
MIDSDDDEKAKKLLSKNFGLEERIKCTNSN